MIEQNLSKFGVRLSARPPTIGSYSPVIVTGNLAFVSGQIAMDPNKQPPEVKFKGKVGKDVSVSDAKMGARLCVISGLSHLKSVLGDLDRIKRFVKLSGFINCEPSFELHAIVMNGASDFLKEIFEEKGKHTRVAVGASSLPMNSCVEIDIIVEI